MEDTEEEEVWRRVECQNGLEVHGMLDGGLGLKECLTGPMDAAATLKLKQNQSREC